MIPEHLALEYPEFEGNSLPPLLREAARIYGIHEWPGEGSNPVILRWAATLTSAGYKDFARYTDDGLPWCALGMSWIAFRAGYVLPAHPGWSQGWKKFGTEAPDERPGDVVVFGRPDPLGVLPPGSLGHVAVLVRAEPDYLHIIGCNQADMVNVMRKSREHLIAVRRPPPLTAANANVVKVAAA